MYLIGTIRQGNELNAAIMAASQPQSQAQPVHAQIQQQQQPLPQQVTTIAVCKYYFNTEAYD